MEPRVPSAEVRLKAITALTDAGIPTSVLMAPLIPAINDAEIEDVLAAVADAGASHAHYIFLRLPHEVRDLFIEWLAEHFPDRAKRVMSLVREASGGRDYDNRFGLRQAGRGAYADMLRKRFNGACRRHSLTPNHYQQSLACDLFERPGQQQLGLNL
jgi:DNA repair photolyase